MAVVIIMKRKLKQWWTTIQSVSKIPTITSQLSPLTLIHWKQNRTATYDVGSPCPGHDLGQAHRCGGVQWDSNSRSPPSIAGSYNSWIYIHLFSGIKLANGPHLISRWSANRPSNQQSVYPLEKIKIYDINSINYGWSSTQF